MNSNEIRSFFLDHLNNIYCAKAHLVERLPEIIDNANFADLKNVIKITIADVDKQLAEMDEIYALLDTKYSFKNCASLIGSLDSSFISIQEKGEITTLRDLLIISYIYITESMEMTSFKLLQLISIEAVNAKIKPLLQKISQNSNTDKAIITSIIENINLLNK